MAQTVQILRSNTNTPPATLLAGAFSAELGPRTKLWIGSPGGNRLLLSSDPADSNISIGAPINSPIFTGNPTAPTPPPGDNDTSIATTAFVTELAGHYLPLIGGNLTGNLSISNAAGSPTLVLSKQVGANQVLGYHAGSPRWGVRPGNDVAEAGSNTGSNFDIIRFNDAGVFVNIPLSISRASGITSVTTLNAGQYNLGGSIFASTASNTTYLYGITGTNNLAFQPTANYYRADSHVFLNNGGVLTTASIDNVGNISTNGNYIHFAGTGGVVNTTGGPLIYADINNHVYKQGSGNGNWVFQNYAGTSVAYITGAGGLQLNNVLNVALDITARDISATRNIWASAVTASYIHSTGNLDADGAVNGGSLHTTGNISGRDITASGTVFTQYLNASAGVSAPQLTSTGNINAAGTVIAAYIHSTGNIQADSTFTGAAVNVSGDIYGAQLRGGSADAGYLKTIPTADPQPHVASFGWAGDPDLVFYLNIDSSRTMLVPWSDDVKTLSVQADAGAPAGWHLAVFSGGLINYFYSDVASDSRLKQGIADSEIDALAALIAVPIRRFEWRDEVQKTFGVPQAPVECGLVAQELLHLPGVVGVSPPRGEPYPEDTHTIMHDRIHAYTIRAIQQLTARVAALEGGA